MKNWTPCNLSEENNRWNTLALGVSRELCIKAVAALDARKNENILEWARNLAKDVAGAND